MRRALPDVNIESRANEQLCAELRQVMLGPVCLSVIEAGAQVIWQNSHTMTDTESAAYYLLQLDEGRFEVQLGNETVSVRAPECMLLDGCAQYRIDFARTWQCRVLQLPACWLGRWLPYPDQHTRRPFAAKAGWGCALAHAVASLDPGALDPLPLPGGLIAEQIALLIAHAAGSAPSVRQDRRGHFKRIVADLSRRYHECDLAPAMLAEAHHISTRYLHALFHRSGTTFRNALIRLRLEHAALLLKDARLADVPIAVVGRWCGFAEATSFGRCFRRRYGTSPSSYRLQHLKH